MRFTEGCAIERCRRPTLRKRRKGWDTEPYLSSLRFSADEFLKQCGLVVECRRLRSGGARATNPVFFDIEKHHGVGDDIGGVLLVAEINLALNALHGGGVEVQIGGKVVVSQGAVLLIQIRAIEPEHVSHVLNTMRTARMGLPADELFSHQTVINSIDLYLFS